MEGMVEHAGSQAGMAHNVFRHVGRADSQVSRNGIHTGRQAGQSKKADRSGHVREGRAEQIRHAFR
jgi:hypothetical protein